MKTILLAAALMILSLVACVDLAKDPPSEFTVSSNLCTEDDPGCQTDWRVGTARSYVQAQYPNDTVDYIRCTVETSSVSCVAGLRGWGADISIFCIWWNCDATGCHNFDCTIQ